jgi:hypothetical protein
MAQTAAIAGNASMSRRLRSRVGMEERGTTGRETHGEAALACSEAPQDSHKWSCRSAKRSFAGKSGTILSRFPAMNETICP